MRLYDTIIVALALLFVLAACAREPAIRGHLVRSYQLEELANREGLTQKDILTEMGSPSFESDDGRTWYYVSYTSIAPTIFPEEIEDVKIYMVAFDDAQNLLAIGDVEKSTWSAREEVAMAREQTPHPEGDRFLFRELFGRIGTIDFRNQLE